MWTKGYPPAQRGVKQSQGNVGQQGQVRVFHLDVGMEMNQGAQDRGEHVEESQIGVKPQNHSLKLKIIQNLPSHLGSVN